MLLNLIPVPFHHLVYWPPVLMGGGDLLENFMMIAHSAKITDMQGSDKRSRSPESTFCRLSTVWIFFIGILVESLFQSREHECVVSPAFGFISLDRKAGSQLEKRSKSLIPEKPYILQSRKALFLYFF